MVSVLGRGYPLFLLEKPDKILIIAETAGINDFIDRIFRCGKHLSSGGDTHVHQILLHGNPKALLKNAVQSGPADTGGMSNVVHRDIVRVVAEDIICGQSRGIVELRIFGTPDITFDRGQEREKCSRDSEFPARIQIFTLQNLTHISGGFFRVDGGIHRQRRGQAYKMCIRDRRELATLRMLGLSDRQCLDTVSVSQWLLTFGGVILGVPMTMGASRLISSTMALELFSIPDFVDGASLLVSVGLIFLAVAMSNRAILKKMKKITPVELLRERE